MLQDMDLVEACCICYVEVGMLNQLEQIKICVLNVTKSGMAMLTVHHYMMSSICFVYDPRVFVRPISADIPSIEESAVYISQTPDFGSCSPRFIPLKKYTMLDQPGANRRMVGNQCNLHLYAAGFMLCRTCKLAVTHSILT